MIRIKNSNYYFLYELLQEKYLQTRISMMEKEGIDINMNIWENKFKII